MAIHRRLSHHDEAGRLERVDKLAGDDPDMMSSALCQCLRPSKVRR
jgi:hypothetical protein